MSEPTPVDLDATRRNFITEMLAARNQASSTCECQASGPDAVSVDGDWLHFAGVRFAETVSEVERLRAEVQRLTRKVTRATVHVADGSVAELPPSMFWTMNGIVDEFGKDITS